MTSKNRRTLIRIGAGVVFFAILLWLMKALESVTTVILVAFFLAYILNPVVERLAAWGLGRSLAAFGILVIVLLIFVGLIMALVPAVVDEISAFAVLAPKYVITLRDLIFFTAEKLNIPIPQDWDQVATMLAEKGKEWLPRVSTVATGVLGSVFRSTLQILSVILHVALVPIVAYYFMVSFANIKTGIAELIPPYTRETVLGRLGEIDLVLAGFIRGQLTIALIMAGLYTIGFLLIGIDLAIVLGTISGLLFFIPYLGTLFALGAGTAMALAKYGDLAHMFYVVGWIAAVQTLEAYVLTPRIVGHAIGLPPVVYILAVISGAELFGFVGMLVAIPVTAILLVLLKSAAQAYRTSYLYNDPTGQD
ncbi:MAG: AI-2E family transporter [Desulfomonile tiedjei]|nr:AI-2E family transporter [Desulfomonile tiedjei]